MSNLDRIKSILEQERYTQGFNAVPVYLNRAGYSGIAMEREVGVRYSGFAIRYQRSWAEYSYVVSDFERIWRTLRDHWLADARYFVSLKQASDRRFAAYDDVLNRRLSEQLGSVSDGEFLGWLDRSRRAMVDVGISSHVTEAVSWGADRKLRLLLARGGLSGKALDEAVASLTLPDHPSWVTVEQRELEAIHTLSRNNRTAALDRHLDRWYWISASYAGRRDLTRQDLEVRLDSVGNARSSNGRSRNEHVPVVDPEAERIAELLRFITTWHDERKANILRAIDALSRALDELADRAHADRPILDYLTVDELDNLRSLRALELLVPSLQERPSGVWSLVDADGDTPFAGAEFSAVDRLRTTIEAMVEHTAELHGNSAQAGKVSAPVALCLGIDAINSFPDGAILVTSMTRPEFMPAIRRAAAIITDEGGITCHAAIIARELGKPCIIGTKVATKLLRDGELVEVNANHGIIRRIGALDTQ